MDDSRQREAASPDEERLVALAKHGDSQAFGRLYQRYVDRVYSFIAFRVRDVGQAEDLTQEVFLQALRGLDSFEWRGSMAPWLLRIARNAIIDHWRRKARRPEQPWAALESEEEEGQRSRIERVATDDEVGHGMARAELSLDRDRIMEASRHLTELQQQVVALRFSASLSIKETAEVMGRSEGAIKNLQHHALKALRRRLDSPVSRSGAKDDGPGSPDAEQTEADQ
jgi:RNA polymerase sigma-70 factor (ECF subfamily)